MIINPNFATLITQNRQDEIKTTIDLTRKDRYRLPDQLWQLQQQGGAWLPPIQGREWKTMDI
ncbi:MAG: hypothetical protein Q4G13_09835 [Moraxella sp.]|nr:hypothetical protein [Moraxella sp.]